MQENHSLQQTVRELEKRNADLNKRLTSVCMYKDNETGNHILRVGEISRFLAEKIGASPEEAELIGRAAPIHDIGKIGVPDSILYKPGQLTLSEFEIAKTHTLIGGKILNDPESIEIEYARAIALYHHEWWDGNGYPHGLSGADIPLSARITAVADVFDVLLSWRPYKEPISVPMAAKIIDRNRGTQFDPAIAAAFTKHIGEIRELRNHILQNAPTPEKNDNFITDPGRNRAYKAPRFAAP